MAIAIRRSAESNVVTNDGNPNSHDDNMSDMVGDEDAETVWVEAEIKSVTPETRVLSAEHEPVPQWQWPSMTMNFFVAEEVDFNQLQAGTQLHMQIGMRADVNTKLARCTLCRSRHLMISLQWTPKALYLLRALK